MIWMETNTLNLKRIEILFNRSVTHAQQFNENVLDFGWISHTCNANENLNYDGALVCLWRISYVIKQCIKTRNTNTYGSNW